MRRPGVVSAVTSVMNREQVEFVARRFAEANNDEDRTGQTEGSSLALYNRPFLYPSIDQIVTALTTLYDLSCGSNHRRNYVQLVCNVIVSIPLL